MSGSLGDAGRTVDSGEPGLSMFLGLRALLFSRNLSGWLTGAIAGEASLLRSC